MHPWSSCLLVPVRYPAGLVNIVDLDAYVLCCRFGFIDNLTLGGPTPLGARAANLTEMTRPFMEEIALNEQGHALFTRQAGSTIPCPLVDFDGGFNDFMVSSASNSNSLDVTALLSSYFNQQRPLLCIIWSEC